MYHSLDRNSRIHVWKETPSAQETRKETIVNITTDLLSTTEIDEVSGLLDTLGGYTKTAGNNKNASFHVAFGNKQTPLKELKVVFNSNTQPMPLEMLTRTLSSAAIHIKPQLENSPS